MKNRIVKVMMISVTMMMMVTGCKDTTKNSEDTAKSNDVKSIETSVELPMIFKQRFIILTVKRNLINVMKLYNIVTER